MSARYWNDPRSAERVTSAKEKSGGSSGMGGGGMELLLHTPTWERGEGGLHERGWGGGRGGGRGGAT